MLLYKEIILVAGDALKKRPLPYSDRVYHVLAVLSNLRATTLKTNGQAMQSHRREKSPT